MAVQILRAYISLLGQRLIIHSFQIPVECISNLCALHRKKQLALLHVIAKTCMDIYDTAAGYRDDRDFSRDIRIYRARDLEFRRNLNLARGDDWEFASVIGVHSDDVHIRHFDHTRSGRSPISLFFSFAAQQGYCHQHCQYEAESATAQGMDQILKEGIFHWITSRP